MSECSEPEQECRKCDESDKAKLFSCSACDPNVFLCEMHWEVWEPHQPPLKPKQKSKSKSKSKLGEAVKHERLPLREQAEYMRRASTRDEEDGEAYSEQHRYNLQSFWFGADLINSSFHINSELYGHIILSSTFRDREKQFPSLVSFIGSTGAGKSTLIVSSTHPSGCTPEHLFTFAKEGNHQL